MTLAEIKRRVETGQFYDVTNHYITRPGHPSFGTTRRVVVRTTTSRIYLSMAAADLEPGHAEPAREIDWPKARQVQMDDDGVIRLYGGGAGQDPGDLFLTLVPVTDGVRVRCPACTEPGHDQCGGDATCRCCRDSHLPARSRTEP
jgi:hypothetical protein